MAVRAARTRSRASPTALSARPTIRKAGSPLEICTCTSTGTASIPEKAKLWIQAMVMRRFPTAETDDDVFGLRPG